jgi:hypothetical protein
MSLKIHLLHSHLDFFLTCTISDEQSERFYKDVIMTEQHYQGRWDAAMVSDYCTFLQRRNEIA